MNTDRITYLKDHYKNQINEALGFYDSFKYGKPYSDRPENYYIDCNFDEDTIESWAYWVWMTGMCDEEFVTYIVPEWWNNGDFYHGEYDSSEYKNPVLDEDRDDLIELLLDYIQKEHISYRENAEHAFEDKWNISFNDFMSEHPGIEDDW